MNSIKKGLRAQRKVREYLYEHGAELVYIIHHTRFSKDIFGLFDGFYIKEGMICFFQVKSNRKPTMKPYREFTQKYRLPTQVFVVKDRKGVFEYC